MRKLLVRARASSLSPRSAPGVAVGVSAAMLVACGGPPPPVAPIAAPEKPKPVEIAVAPAPDVSPVAEPKGLVAFGRVAHAEQSANAIVGWTGMPLPGAKEALGAVLGEELAGVVDIDKPFDFAVRVAGNKRAPTPQFVVSIPLTSLDEAKAKLSKFTLTPMPNGVIKVDGLAPPPKDETDEPRVCVMGATPGSAPARLVCGDQGAVESMAPYAMRTLSIAPSQSDVHIEMQFGAVRESLESVRRLLPALAGGMLEGKKDVGPATRDIIEAAVGDLADFAVDSDRVTLDIDAKPEGAKARLRYSFRTQQATLTKMLVAGVKEVGPPPPALVGLPADVDMAAWTRPGDPTLYDRPRKLFAAFLDETLASDVPAADRKAIVALLADRTLPIFQGGMVFGRGYDLDALKAAAVEKDGANATDKQRAEQKAALATQAVGYTLMRLERPAAQVALVIKDWATLGLKVMRTKSAKDKSKPPLPTLRAAAVGAGLPAGTTHLELAIPRPPRRDDKGKVTFAPKPVIAHIFIAPSDASAPGTSWVAVGLDPKLVAARMIAARTPTGPTLGTRPESKELLATASRSGFLVTPRLAALVKVIDRGGRGAPGSSADMFATAFAASAPEAPTPQALGGAFVTTIFVPKQAIGATVSGLMRR
ncbi:MAG: hypothetical protein IPQ09_09985 [Myxococcales bacterium]|nr:hypothetical protein [Myxococcales bacterium]HQY61069.1 hypothetical protein [Polyangiaceae bacterium]